MQSVSTGPQSAYRERGRPAPALLRRLLAVLGGGLFVAVAAGLVVLGLGVSPALAAGSGYAPPPVVLPSAPGSFSNVISAQNVPQGGGTLTVTHNGEHIDVVIPADALCTPTATVPCATYQIIFTSPNIIAVPGGVTGIGLEITRSGQPLKGTFEKSLSFTITDASISSSDLVEVWNGSAFVPVPGAIVTTGKASASFDTDPDFAVVQPKVAIPTATTVETGEPFFFEGLLAAGLLLSGLALLGHRRLRLRRSAPA